MNNVPGGLRHRPFLTPIWLTVIAAFLAFAAVVTAAVITDLPPLLKWSTAVIAGGGAAGLTQGLTSLLRVGSRR